MTTNKKMYVYILGVLVCMSAIFNIYQYDKSFQYKRKLDRQEQAFKEQLEDKQQLLNNKIEINQELTEQLKERDLKILELKNKNKNFSDSLDKYKRLYGNIYYYDIYSFKYVEPPEDYYINSKAIINIFNKNDNSIFQTLEIIYEDKDKFIGMAATFNICIFDTNFDGIDDILIDIGDSGASYGYWAYIFENGEYKYSKSFSEIPSPEFDIKNKRILGSYRSSANLHSHVMYEFIDGKFQEASRIDLVFIDNNRLKFSEYKIIDSKDVEISSNIFDSFKNSIYYDDAYWGLASDRWKDAFEYSSQLLN